MKKLYNTSDSVSDRRQKIKYLSVQLLSKNIKDRQRTSVIMSRHIRCILILLTRISHFILDEEFFLLCEICKMNFNDSVNKLESVSKEIDNFITVGGDCRFLQCQSLIANAIDLINNVVQESSIHTQPPRSFSYLMLDIADFTHV